MNGPWLAGAIASAGEASVLEEVVLEDSPGSAGRSPVFLTKLRTVVIAERSGQTGVLLAVEGDRIVGAGGLEEEAVADLGAQSIGQWPDARPRPGK